MKTIEFFVNELIIQNKYNISSIIEIGFGAGVYSKMLREAFPESYILGFEPQKCEPRFFHIFDKILAFFYLRATII